MTKLTDLLNDDDANIEITKIKSSKLGEGLRIKYTAMYDAPELSFKLLKELSDFFGTLEIDVDSISERGCQTCSETCDYGSCYGHDIEIYRITKNGDIAK